MEQSSELFRRIPEYRPTSRRFARALISDKAVAGSVFIPFHFAEAAANRLTNAALDPISKIPEYKVCAIRLEKEEV